jgi:cytochrome c oxidase subunit 4
MSQPHTATHRTLSPLAYVGVYLALLAGLGMQIVLSQTNLGILNPILTLAIAFAQAAIVALFSMHAKYSSKLTQFSIFAGLFTLGILVAMALSDYVSRAWGQW